MKGAVNKKILFIICAIVVVVVLIVSVSLSSTPRPTQQTSSNQEASQNPSSSTTTTSTTKTYHGSNYTFSYPNGWINDEKQLPSNSGIVFNIQPPTQDPSEYTNISVEVFNAQVTQMKTLTNLFKFTNYTQETSQVAGVTAQKYSDVIQSNTGNLHTISYIFQKDNKIYFLKLEYMRPSVDEELENQFNQIVTSFSLQ